jgi:hypothetical protein
MLTYAPPSQPLPPPLPPPPPLLTNCSGDCSPRLAARILTCNKDGPNKDRVCYRCKSCGFFLWADDAQDREANVNLAKSTPIKYEISSSPEIYVPQDTPANPSKSCTPNPLDSRAPTSTSFGLSTGDDLRLASQLDAPITTQAKREFSRITVASQVEPTAQLDARRTTQAKRKFSRITANDGHATGLNTPSTHKFARRSRTNDIVVLDDEVLNLVSPHSTPTLSQSRPAAQSAAPGNELWAQLDEVLAEEHVSLSEGTRERLAGVCDTHARKVLGLEQSYVFSWFRNQYGNC